VGQIPWGHNRVLLDRVNDQAEREWYARATIEHGWSRAVLDYQIDTGLLRRQGLGRTNFSRTRSAPAGAGPAGPQSSLQSWDSSRSSTLDF
jgi:predicted nuclease of restriction endonuclease-like (RecB) superfamily